jgi:hypothetical protein
MLQQFVIQKKENWKATNNHGHWRESSSTYTSVMHFHMLFSLRMRLIGPPNRWPDVINSSLKITLLFAYGMITTKTYLVRKKTSSLCTVRGVNKSDRMP